MLENVFGICSENFLDQKWVVIVKGSSHLEFVQFIVKSLLLFIFKNLNNKHYNTLNQWTLT